MRIANIEMVVYAKYEEKCIIHNGHLTNVHKSAFSLCYLVLWNYITNQKIMHRKSQDKSKYKIPL